MLKSGTIQGQTAPNKLSTSQKLVVLPKLCKISYECSYTFLVLEENVASKCVVLDVYSVWLIEWTSCDICNR